MTTETILPNSNPGPVSAPVSQEQLAALNPDQLASLNATRAKYGLPAYAAEKPADNVNASADATKTMMDLAVEKLRTMVPGKTDDEYRQMVQAQHGDINKPKPADPIFHSSLNAPASEREYDLDGAYVGRNLKGDIKARTTFDAEARTALKAMEVPKLMAAGLLGAALDAGQTWSGHTTQAARDIYTQTQNAILNNWQGDGGADNARKLADVAINKMAEPVRKAWEQVGLFSSARVIITLAGVGKMITQRAAKKAT